MAGPDSHRGEGAGRDGVFVNVLAPAAEGLVSFEDGAGVREASGYQCHGLGGGRGGLKGVARTPADGLAILEGDSTRVPVALWRGSERAGGRGGGGGGATEETDEKVPSGGWQFWSSQSPQQCSLDALTKHVWRPPAETAKHGMVSRLLGMLSDVRYTREAT